MIKQDKKERLALTLSGIYYVGALLLLLGVLGLCRPELQAYCRTAAIGRDTGPLQAAFQVLTDGLEHGNSLADACMEAAETAAPV